MEWKGKKKNFQKEKAFELRKELIYRGWNQCSSSINQTVSAINQQYDDLKVKIEIIQSTIDNKTAKLIEIKKNKDIENQRLKTTIATLKSRNFRLEDDSTIETEAKLSIEAQILRQKLQEIQKQTAINQEKAERNKRLFLRAKDRLQKEKAKISTEQKIQQLDDQMKQKMKEFREKIENEKLLLDKDMETLQLKLNMFLHPNEYQNPNEKYRSMLVQAKQWSNNMPDMPNTAFQLQNFDHGIEIPLPPQRESDSQSLTGFYQNYDDSDIPVLEQPTKIRSQQNINPNGAKIQSLQNNIKILLSSGQYHEGDPIIRDLRQQIENLQ